MPRWIGDRGSVGRTCQAVMLYALRGLMERFPAAVVIVRTHPKDDEYDALGLEFGDPAICESLLDEYAGQLPDGCPAGDDDDEEDEDDA